MRAVKGLAAVPSFGVCQVAGGSDIGGESVAHVRQYLSTGGAGVMIAGPLGVPNGSYGSAGYHNDIRAKCETASTGDHVGPVPGSWELQLDSTEKLFVVVRHNGDGTAHVNRLDAPASSLGDFGVARLSADLEDTDATGTIVGYTPVLGTAEPSGDPATVGNVNGLEGGEGDTVIVVLSEGDWQIAAVLEFSDAEHGFCRPYADFDDGDAAIRPAGYQSVEGADEPDDATTSVANPGFSAKTTDTLAVAKRAGIWTVCYVIKGVADAVRYGVVKEAAAASWNNSTNTLTPGVVEAWEFSDVNTIDREGVTVELNLRWTEAPVEGSLIGWVGDEIVVMTCGPLEDWE